MIANEVAPVPPLQRNNAQNMAETVDAVYRDGIQAGTNFYRLTDDLGAVSGTNRSDVIGKINPVGLDKAFRNLQNAVAPQWTDAISPTTKINTAGVLPGYIMIIHPDVYYDARQMPGFDEAFRVYTPSLLGEVGAYRNIRFVCSTQARVYTDTGAAVSGTGKKSTTGTSADVYSGILLGKESYACIKIADMARIIWIPPTQVDHLNPTGQYGTLGWKAMCGSGIVNDNWILRFECAASA
jgi:N4-gp56 family major capsid protein